MSLQKINFINTLRNPVFLLSFFAFIFSFTVFWWNAAPSVTYRDSGEFALAAASGGIPHPPGAPTWSLFATLFVQLFNFDDPARGTNLFSAFCGALTIAFLTAWVFVFCKNAFPNISNTICAIASVSSAIILLHSSAFYEMSITTEQYTLLTALMSLALLLTTHIIYNPLKTKPVTLLSLGIVWGLAIGNHLSQLVLAFAISWTLIVLWKHSEKSLRTKYIAHTSLGLFIGLLVFLYLPIRSNTNPILDWGNPENLENVISALRREHWQGRPISESPPGFASAWIQSYELLTQIGIIGVIAALSGLFVFAKKAPPYTILLFGVFVPYALGMMISHMAQANISLSYISHYGVTDWHLPIYLFCALISGGGTAFILHTLKQKSNAIAAYGMSAALIVALLFGAYANISKNSLRNSDSAQRYIQVILEPLPEDAIIVATADDIMFMIGYHRYALDKNSQRYVAWGISPLPLFIHQVEESGGGWDRKKLLEYLQVEMLKTENQPLNLPKLSEHEIDSRKVFTDYMFIAPNSAKYLIPVGFLFEVRAEPTTNEEIITTDDEWKNKFLSEEMIPQNLDFRAIGAWADLFASRGAFFYERKLYERAAENYEWALKVNENIAEVWFGYGIVLKALQRWKDSAIAFEKALQLDPRMLGVRYQLAQLNLAAGYTQDAITLLEEELKLNPDNQSAKELLEKAKR